MSPLTLEPLPFALASDDDLRRLRAVSGYPLITVLVTTSPASAMTAHDRRALFALVDRAEARVRQELGDPAAAELCGSLRGLAERAARGATLRGLALFAGGDVAAAYLAPGSIGDRVIVDPTFATSELTRALAEHPSHRVLLVSTGSARLLRSEGTRLVEVETGGFPLRADSDDADRRGHLHEPDRSQRRSARSHTFVRSVARTRAREPTSTDLPLFVAAAEPTLGRFRTVCELPIAGEIRGNHEHASPARVAELVAPLVEAHVDRLRAEDLATLQIAVDRRRARFGVDDVWAAVQTDQVRLLLVEAGFRFAARVAPDGLSITRATDPDAPDVIDDVVDDIVEAVISRGGRVRFVEPGSVHAGIAAVS